MQRFTGKGFIGLNNTKASHLIDDMELQDMQDVRVNTDLSLTERKGYTNLLASAETNAINKISQISVGSSKYTLCGENNDVKKVAGTSLTSLKSGLIGKDYSETLKFNDKILMSNGVNNVIHSKIIQGDFVFIVDSVLCKVFKYDLNMNLIDSFGSSGTGNYQFQAPQSITTDGTFVYVLDYTAMKIKKYTIDLSYVTEFALTGFSGAGGANSFLSVSGATLSVIMRATYNFSSDVYGFELNASTGAIGAVVDLDAGNLTGAVVDTTNNVFYYSNGTNLYKFDFISSPTSILSDVTLLAFDGVSVYGVSGTSIKKYTSSLSLTSTTAFTGYTFNYIYSYYGSLYCIYSNSGILVIDPSAMTVVKNYLIEGGLSSPYGFSATNNNLVAFYDICSPYKPVQNVLSDVGLVNATTYYRSTWYNSDTGLETSGGLASASAAPSSKKVEVFFDFTDSQIDKAKADAILVDRHRLYRKEGTNNYLLQGTYPIYWELAADLSSAGTSLTVTNAEGMTFSENFYILIDDEIILVTGISGTTFNITRAQKGTTAAAHDIESPIYIYSIIDNVATASLGAVIPTVNDYVQPGKYMITHKNRFVMANSQSYTSRVWYSGFNTTTLAGDEDIITETSWHDVNPNDSDEITGMTVYQDNLMVTKNRSIWYFPGDLDGTRPVKFSDKVGCAADKTIAHYGGGFTFLSTEGWMYVYGMQIFNLSRNFIQGTIDTINWQYAYKAWSVYYPARNEIWLSVPTGSSTTCNKIIVLNTALSTMMSEDKPKSFYVFNMSLSAGAVILDSSDKPVLYTATTGGQLVKQDDGYVDGSTAIDSYAILKDLNFGYDFHKKFRGIITDYKGESTATNIVLGYTTATSYTSSNISQNYAGRQYNKTSISANGNYLRIKYSNNTSGGKWTVYNFMVEFKIHKIR